MSQIKYFSREQTDNILSVIKNEKHRLITLLMLDCGLRVSEVISLRFKNFDIKRELVVVESLKKRDKKLVRSIPISKRVYQALAIYLGKLSDVNGDDYLFPSSHYDDRHISRFSVNKFLASVRKKHGVLALLV